MIDEQQKRNLLADVIAGKLTVEQMRERLRHTHNPIFTCCYKQTEHPAADDMVLHYDLNLKVRVEGQEEEELHPMTYAKFLKTGCVYLEECKPEMFNNLQ